MLLLDFTYEKHYKARPEKILVIRHWYVIGTKEQQLHKISH